jgi:BASS family bile acid:Na+ symporter
MSPWAVATTVLVSIIAPLAAGILLRAIAPSFAQKLARPIGIIAAIMLLAGALPVLIAAWPAITSLIGNGSVAAFAGFAVIGLAAGHVLGGPDSDDRTVLALSTASRHPGIAIAIAHTNFPQQKLAMAAVALYLLVSVIVTIPYLNWNKHRHADVAQPPETQHPASA